MNNFKLSKRNVLFYLFKISSPLFLLFLKLTTAVIESRIEETTLIQPYKISFSELEELYFNSINESTQKAKTINENIANRLIKSNLNNLFFLIIKLIKSKEIFVELYLF